MAIDQTIEHNGDRIPYSIVRSNRRRTIAVIVARDGAVSVRAPRWVPEREVIRVVESRSAWIARKRAEFEGRQATGVAPLAPSELAEAERLFAERLHECWKEFAAPGESMPTPRVRTMRSRWGSLSPRGAMSLNAYLVRASACCVDYVIFHELCHLRVRGHGSDFYRELARYVPDWKSRRRELRATLS